MSKEKNDLEWVGQEYSAAGLDTANINELFSNLQEKIENFLDFMRPLNNFPIQEFEKLNEVHYLISEEKRPYKISAANERLRLNREQRIKEEELLGKVNSFMKTPEFGDSITYIKTFAEKYDSLKNTINATLKNVKTIITDVDNYSKSELEKLEKLQKNLNLTQEEIMLAIQKGTKETISNISEIIDSYSKNIEIKDADLNTLKQEFDSIKKENENLQIILDKKDKNYDDLKKEANLERTINNYNLKKELELKGINEIKIYDVATQRIKEKNAENFDTEILLPITEFIKKSPEETNCYFDFFAFKKEKKLTFLDETYDDEEYSREFNKNINDLELTMAILISKNPAYEIPISAEKTFSSKSINSITLNLYKDQELDFNFSKTSPLELKEFDDLRSGLTVFNYILKLFKRNEETKDEKTKLNIDYEIFKSIALTKITHRNNQQSYLTLFSTENTSYSKVDGIQIGSGIKIMQ
ncbi:hypothetical protein K9L97_03600 [Candidatus Woesearchaeota archaeon]|nr:hypothetical protein [Candidatus Woesearchaeota archaeon]